MQCRFQLLRADQQECIVGNGAVRLTLLIPTGMLLSGETLAAM